MNKQVENLKFAKKNYLRLYELYIFYFISSVPRRGVGTGGWDRTTDLGLMSPTL